MTISQYLSNVWDVIKAVWLGFRGIDVDAQQILTAELSHECRIYCGQYDSPLGDI